MKCNASKCRRNAEDGGHFCAWHYQWLPITMRFAVACEEDGAVVVARVHLATEEARDAREVKIQNG